MRILQTKKITCLLSRRAKPHLLRLKKPSQLKRIYGKGAEMRPKDFQKLIMKQLKMKEI
jgi:hypothetical protein